MNELIDQIEARLEQAIKESNLDNRDAQVNLALIQTLTNLLAVLYNSKETWTQIKVWSQEEGIKGEKG